MKLAVPQDWTAIEHDQISGVTLTQFRIISTVGVAKDFYIIFEGVILKAQGQVFGGVEITPDVF